MRSLCRARLDTAAMKKQSGNSPCTISDGVASFGNIGAPTLEDTNSMVLIQTIALLTPSLPESEVSKVPNECSDGGKDGSV
mmetsp:Transcript_130176/g.225060  ORF Transcript_130176/g.225060 Transcript_130176/m.225060 type:complete len:81 (+) Transcript_130176:720-962(+)